MVARNSILKPLILASLLTVGWVASAHAQAMARADADALKAGLAKNSHEVPAGVAVDFMGRPVVLFLSPTGTYTLVLLVAGRDGRRLACIHSLGTGWQTIVPPPGKPS